MAKRTIPKSGWVVVGHIDHRAPVIPCAKCNRHVRYGVVMRHPDVQGTIEAGARCAVWLSGGTPERLAAHDAPAVPAATVSAEAAIEAIEAADAYGAELGENADPATWNYAGSQWVRWLDDRRKGVPLPEMRRRAGLVPGASRQTHAPYAISLRRMGQIADYLVAHHATPLQAWPGLPAPPAEMLLMHLPRAERHAALAAQRDA